MSYNISETFISINGEGKKAGELALFIRLTGCNLRCGYCDTLWATDPNATHTAMSLDEILKLIKESSVKNITLTGGEPLCHEGIEVLIEGISKLEGKSLEIETNGSVDIRSFKKSSQNVSFTVDYKSPSSGMNSWMLNDNYQTVDQRDTVKFVVGTYEDLEVARKVINEHQLLEKTSVYFSPIFGAIEGKDIVEYMIKHNLNGVRLQLQLHKYIWHPEEKGV
ncbi:MAG: putative 7-carboxy-7-deazaguanine synthase QueE [Clostridia bacterium]|nr:putative 7-carboxy-7-deazaguanine synthase QueE [Clostridia bacterium]